MVRAKRAQKPGPVGHGVVARPVLDEIADMPEVHRRRSIEEREPAFTVLHRPSIRTGDVGEDEES